MDVTKHSQPVIGTKPVGLPTQASTPQTQREGMPKVESGEQQASEKELGKVVNDLNKWVQQTQTTHLQFRLHEKLNEYYVEIVDDLTKEVVREVPSKKILDVAAKMQEMIGLLVDEKR